MAFYDHYSLDDLFSLKSTLGWWVIGLGAVTAITFLITLRVNWIRQKVDDEIIGVQAANRIQDKKDREAEKKEFQTKIDEANARAADAERKANPPTAEKFFKWGDSVDQRIRDAVTSGIFIFDAGLTVSQKETIEKIAREDAEGRIKVEDVTPEGSLQISEGGSIRKVKITIAPSVFKDGK